MKKHWLIGGLAGVVALAGLAFVQGGDAEGEADPVVQAAQPIAFPHDVHAGSEPGQSNIPCQFCHFSAERSVDAGIPPVSSCWGCHQVIPGTTPQQQQEIAKIREYVAEDEPIPWVRIYKISDHTHFPHMRHINAGLTCQECHGEVQTQGVLAERDPVWGGDNMGWCISCHRLPDPVTDEQQASTDCAVCHY
jgi:cytochrome c7-like protein